MLACVKRKSAQLHLTPGGLVAPVFPPHLPPPPPEDLPGAQAVTRARLHDPLIGRAGPLVKLFCLSGQRIKAAAAALGTVLPQFSYPLPGCPAKQLGRATPGRLVAEEPLVLFPCVAAEICKRDPSSKTAEHPLPTSRAQQPSQAESEVEFYAAGCRAVLTPRGPESVTPSVLRSTISPGKLSHGGHRSERLELKSRHTLICNLL